MSKSWIIMSRKIPPDTLTYSGGGGAGSRLMTCSRCGSPISPRWMASRTRAKVGSKRRLKPTWNLTPACSTARSTWSIRTRSSSIGFSVKMCLPAAAAASITLACVSVDEHTRTASTAGSVTAA